MAVSLTLRPWVGRSRRSIPRNKGLAIKTSRNGKHGKYRWWFQPIWKKNSQVGTATLGSGLIWSYQPKCNPEMACKLFCCFLLFATFLGVSCGRVLSLQFTSIDLYILKFFIRIFQMQQNTHQYLCYFSQLQSIDLVLVAIQYQLGPILIYHKNHGAFDV